MRPREEVVAECIAKTARYAGHVAQTLYYQCSLMLLPGGSYALPSGSKDPDHGPNAIECYSLSGLGDL